MDSTSLRRPSGSSIRSVLRNCLALEITEGLVPYRQALSLRTSPRRPLRGTYTLHKPGNNAPPIPEVSVIRDFLSL